MLITHEEAIPVHPHALTLDNMYIVVSLPSTTLKAPVLHAYMTYDLVNEGHTYNLIPRVAGHNNVNWDIDPDNND